MLGPRPNSLIAETTRQNICQIRGQAFRKIARQLIRHLEGDDAATEDRVRLLAKNEEFQELVGEAFIQHFGGK